MTRIFLALGDLETESARANETCTSRESRMKTTRTKEIIATKNVTIHSTTIATEMARADRSSRVIDARIELQVLLSELDYD